MKDEHKQNNDFKLIIVQTRVIIFQASFFFVASLEQKRNIEMLNIS